jgi:hypothetical protein
VFGFFTSYAVSDRSILQILHQKSKGTSSLAGYHAWSTDGVEQTHLLLHGLASSAAAAAGVASSSTLLSIAPSSAFLFSVKQDQFSIVS